MNKLIRLVLPAIALSAVVFAAACGTVATPAVTARPTVTGTAISEAVTSAPGTAEPTEEVTEAPTATAEPTEEVTEAPTATAEPTEEVTEATTATTVPPTATATQTATAEPTEAVTAAAAGGASGSAEVTGDPEAGAVVFTTQFTTASGMWMCSQCHSVTPDELRLIGPGLWNVAERAETRVEGETAFDYIHNSILHPNDFIAPGDPPYPPGLMPQNYEEVLTEDQLNDLIAYLFTLHD